MPLTIEEQRNRAYKGLKNFVEWLDRYHIGVHIGAIEKLSDSELSTLKSFNEHVQQYIVAKERLQEQKSNL